MMIAYHGKSDLKAAMVALALEHEQADRVIKGTYQKVSQGQWIGGCAVGCTLESARRIAGDESVAHGDHSLYEKYLGVPRALAQLEDGIFESLPEDLAMKWPARFLAAIPPGADLSLVWARFAHWLLTNPDGGVQAGVKRRPSIAPSVSKVAELYQRWIDGTKPSDTEWREARAAAAAAASDCACAACADAAYACAAYACAAYACAAYADAACADAAYAYACASSACASSADRDARSRERVRQADCLISLLESAPVPETVSR